MLLSLFLSAITEDRSPPYTAAARRHLAKLIARETERDGEKEKKRGKKLRKSELK
jgi:hypothetical protein